MKLNEAIAALYEAKSMWQCHKPEERKKRFEAECERILEAYRNA